MNQESIRRIFLCFLLAALFSGMPVNAPKLKPATESQAKLTTKPNRLNSNLFQKIIAAIEAL